MKTIKLWKAFGVLAHEKKPVYTVNPIADYIDTSDQVDVVLPDCVSVHESVTGDVLFEINGQYAKLITTKDGHPVLISGDQRVTLAEA